MRQFYLFLALFSAVLCSCASFSKKTGQTSAATQYRGEAVFSTSLPEGGELVFVGVSPKMTYKKDAITNAVENAAYKVACFHSVVGKYASFTSTGGGGFLDFSQDTATELSPDESQRESYKQYIDVLTYDEERDVYEVNDTVYVRAHYAGATFGVPYGIGVRGSNGAPSWQSNLPEISGYTVSIGIANPRTYHSDTIKDSFDNAIISIIALMNPNITSDVVYGIDNSIGRHYFVSGEAAISGFYVLDFWTDPWGNVWTLGIVRKE